MANQQIDNIEDINEAINPITPPIDGQEGLEMLGHNRNQSVILSRFSRSFFKIYSHLISLYTSIKNLNNNKVSKSGDTMTGSLGIKTGGPIQLILSRNSPKTSNNNIKFQYTDAVYYFGFVNGVLKIGEIEDLTSGFSIYHTGLKPTKTDVGLSNVDNTADSSKNVLSATKLTTARTITIGNKSYTFNGSANLSYSLQDIGALPITGGTVTGPLAVPSGFIVEGVNVIGASSAVTRFGDTERELNLNCLDGVIRVSGKGRVYHEGFKPTPEIIGAVNKTGDTIGNTSATPLILIRNSLADNLNIRFYLPQQNIDKYFGVSSSGKFAIDSAPNLSSSINNLVTENEESFFRKNINLISGSVIKSSNGNNILRTNGNATIVGAEGSSIPADSMTILTAGSNDKAIVRVRSGASSVDERIYHTGNRARARHTHMFTVDVSSGGFYAGSISEYDFIFIKYNFDTTSTGSRTMNSAVTIPSDYRGEVPLTIFLDNVTQHIIFSLENGGIRVRATNDTTNSIVVFGVKIN